LSLLWVVLGRVGAWLAWFKEQEAAVLHAHATQHSTRYLRALPPLPLQGGKGTTKLAALH